MKTFWQIILGSVFISLFLSFLLTTSVKFQFLDANFWRDAFNKSNVYEKLEPILKKEIAKGEAKSLSAIITKENLKDLVEKNLKYFLDFANDKTEKLFFYVPVSKLPASFLPKNLSIKDDVLEAEKVLPLFVQGQTDFQTSLAQISNIGKWATIAWFIALATLGLLAARIYLLTEAGKRLTVLGVSFLVSGVLGLLLSGTIKFLSVKIGRDLPVRSEPANVLLGVLGPPIANQITTLWMIIGGVFAISGVFIMLLRRK